ncbi:MAG: MFS transporter [Parasulfuritortus sp.]|nr:MFS transporter [Parasulfuritortus sp.]
MTQQHEVAGINIPALLSVLLGVALGTLDTAIANTALPAISADLHSDPGRSIWIINAYQLAVVATLLPFAALGDSIGPRKVFLFGVSFFTAASLACTLATTLPALACARALQGIGAGAVMSVNIALIKLIFPPSKLGRGVGTNALVVGIGFAIGPTIASLVLSVASWPWLFGINLPLGTLTSLFALRSLPRHTTPLMPFDRAAALLSAISFSALMFALIQVGQQASWIVVAGASLVATIFTTVLLLRQAGHAAPMLPVDLLKRPMFALSAFTAFASFGAQGLAFVALPFYFEAIMHHDPIQTGFFMSAWAIVVAAAAPLAGRLSDQYHPGLLGGVGLAVLSAGMLTLGHLNSTSSVLHIVIGMGICGAGFGFFQSPNLRALMTSAPPDRSGGASGMIGLVRLTGQATGAALVALCFGLNGVQGATLAIYLGAGFALAGSIASFSRLGASTLP